MRRAGVRTAEVGEGLGGQQAPGELMEQGEEIWQQRERVEVYKILINNLGATVAHPNKPQTQYWCTTQNVLCSWEETLRGNTSPSLHTPRVNVSHIGLMQLQDRCTGGVGEGQTNPYW